MGQGLRVTPEQLHAMAGTVAKTAADQRGATQALRGQLSPLFGADWSGSASAQAIVKACATYSSSSN